jgi:hypothetical protein
MDQFIHRPPESGGILQQGSDIAKDDPFPGISGNGAYCPIKMFTKVLVHQAPVASFRYTNKKGPAEQGLLQIRFSGKVLRLLQLAEHAFLGEIQQH